MIYFVRIDFGAFDPVYKTGATVRRIGFIKIGSAVNVPRRMRQLELEYGKPLSLLVTIPGDRTEEVAMHRRFDHLRLDGTYRNHRPEWFYPARELMDFIRSLQENSNHGLYMVMSKAYN